MTTRLAPNLHDKTYRQLVESALAQLPGLAPQWTDYNAHDPGIAILELLAWTAEAQIYGLARTRRGERSGYAKLMGAAPRGATPAKTLIWPQPEHVTTLKTPVVIDCKSKISVGSAPGLNFMPTRDIAILAAHIASVRSIGPNDKVVDHGLPINGAMTPFVPFGLGDAERWSLQLELLSNTPHPIFKNTADSPTTFSLGFMTAQNDFTKAPGRVALPDVYIVSDGLRRKLSVQQDETQNLRRTGIILLNMNENLSLGTRVTLELSYPRGSGNRNVITHVALNVVPVEQATMHLGETHVANGSADETIKLEHGFVVTDDAASGITIKSWDMGKHIEWHVIDDILSAAPDDHVFIFDIENQTLTFGNGINGKRLPSQQDVVITYTSSEGEAGNVSAGASWKIDGLPGLEFSNFNAAEGGTNIADLEYRQIQARSSAKSIGVLSRTVDLEKAAEELQNLNVFFAVIGEDERCTRHTCLTLFVLRRPSSIDPFAIQEEPDVWAREIKSQLEVRIPLGIKFNVQPVLRSIFRVHAKCRISDAVSPTSVQRDIRKLLEERFKVASAARDALTARLGRRLSKLDMIGLLQSIPSILIVEQLTLSDGIGRAIQSVDVSSNGLVVIDYAGSTFTLLSTTGGFAQ